MRIPIAGMTMSATKDETILPKAVPMITPTARSTTLPLMANSRNSVTQLMDGPLGVADFENFELFFACRCAQAHHISFAGFDERTRDRRYPGNAALRRIHLVDA